MESFANIPKRDIIYFLNYYKIPYGENIYLTAWNFILENKDILIPISIHNYVLDYNLHQTLKISGPISWYQFKIGNKTIDLFGDEHWSKEFSCEKGEYTITKLIDLISKVNINKNVVSDMYFEAAFSLKESVKSIYGSNGYLGEIQRYLDKCLVPNKSECQYNTKIIRFHYIDLRYIYRVPNSTKGRFIRVGFETPNTIKNINDINSLYEYLDAVKFIFMNSLTFFEYCESMDTDFIINIDNLINLLPKTTYGDLFRRKLEKFKYLTSKRNGINVHKNAVQLSQIQDDYIKTR